MLLASASKMNRKPLALAFVLLIAGLAPASAVIGFCSRMPCCSRASHTAPAALSTERNDCCTTIACYESSSAELITATSSVVDVLAMPALLSVVSPPPMPAVLSRAPIDTSPPNTVRHRLAALSILLI